MAYFVRRIRQTHVQGLVDLNHACGIETTVIHQMTVVHEMTVIYVAFGAFGMGVVESKFWGGFSRGPVVVWLDVFRPGVVHLGDCSSPPTRWVGVWPKMKSNVRSGIEDGPRV